MCKTSFATCSACTPSMAYVYVLGLIFLVLTLGPSFSSAAQQLISLPAHAPNAQAQQLKSTRRLNTNQIQAITAELKYLDEVLTASVLSYVFTGEKKWLDRYKAHEPKLNTLLTTLINSQTPANAELISQISSANRQLIKLERKAIALIAQGYRQAAMQLINSEDYSREKERYITLSMKFVNTLEHAEYRPPHRPQLTQVEPLQLTDNERTWLTKHTVKIGVEHWPPIIFPKPNGDIGGLAGGLIGQIAQLTGLNIEVVTGQWHELVEQFKQGQIDIIPDTYFSEARDQFGDFSRPYYVLKERLFILSENKHLSSVADLTSATIAVPKGYLSVEQLGQHYPKMNILATESVDESINAVLSGQADALLDAKLVVQERIKTANITSLAMLDEEIVPSEPLRFFVTSQQPLLLNIINKSLGSLDINQLLKANPSWLDASEVTHIQDLEHSTDIETYYLAAGLVLLLLLLGAGISAIMLRRDDHALAAKFGSKAFKYSVVGGLLGLALILVLVAFIVVNNADNKTKQTLSYNLTTLLTSTHNALTNWVDEELLALNKLSSNPELINMVEQLLLVDRTEQALSSSPVQGQIRQFFSEYNPSSNHAEFFIVAPDMRNLSAENTNQLATRHIINDYYPSVLSQAFTGKSKFVPPIPTEPLSVNGDNSGSTRLFFTTPINDLAGKPIALLVQAVDPSQQFAKLMRTGFIGKTGETYAFNQDGQLVSNVRFENQLKTLGLIDADQPAMLTMRLGDPQKNLLDNGFTPQERANWPLTLMADSATRGFSSNNLTGYRDYRGVAVVGSWLWDENLNIGIAIEVDLAESIALLQIFKYTIFGIIVVSLLLLFGCTLFTLTLGTRATQALSRSHAELECRVAERTSELRSNIERTRSIIDNASDGIIIADEHGHIESFSPSAEQMFGYQAADIIGQPLSTIMELPFHQINPEARANGHVIEQLGLRADGSTFDIGISVSDFSFENNHVYTGAVRDITIRKEAERALEQAKNSAIEATKAKSNFLANMSHEIRTPMNAIIGMSYLALQTELSDKQRDYVNKIHSSADALLGIINEILDFSKIEAGKLTLEHAPFSLIETLDHVVEIIALKSQQKGLELLIDLAPELPTCLVGDSLRLGQILINLANNAIKFTDHGEIIIKVSAIEQSEQSLTLQFSVSDTGIGMTAEQQQRLFKSFSQADTSTTRKYGGTGLGLTICKTLTEMMKGDIWVESEYQQGSTFSFTVQLELAEHPLNNDKLTFADASDIHVLVVDDSLAAREILHTIAENIGFKTTVADSVDQAMQAIRAAALTNAPFDIVLTDWQMPDKSGVELVKEVNQLNLPHQPKFIMITAYDRDDMVNACQQLAVSGYLTKPINASALLDASLNALGRSQKVTKQASFSQFDTASTAAIQGAHILLVEDNEINQQIACELLEMAKFNVTTAANGQQAVEQVQKNKFDAVLMDIQMPIMDGYQATGIIRQQFDADQLPIIAMTANAMPSDRERSLAAGMNDHLNKPIAPNEVFAALARWIKPLAADHRTQHNGPVSVNTQVHSQHGGYQQINARVPMQTDAKLTPPHIDGLDVNGALARMAGNVGLYINLLDKFVSNQGQAADEIKEQLANNDRQTAERTAHTLKGVAANIGANDLSAKAAQLEHALYEQQEDVDTLVKLTEEQLATTVTAIKAQQLLGAVRLSSENTVVDIAKLKVLWQQLHSEIADFDADAQDTWRAMRKVLANELSELIDSQLTKSLSEYDFELAQRQLPSLDALVSEIIN